MKIIISFVVGCLISAVISLKFSSNERNNYSEVTLAKSQSVQRERTQLSKASRSILIAQKRQNIEEISDEFDRLGPQAMLEKYRQDFGRERNQFICEFFFELWADEDQEAALFAAQSEDNRLFNRTALDSVFRVVLTKNPDEALKLLLSLPATANLSFVAESMFENWTNLDRGSLLSKIDGIESPTLKQIALSSAMASLGLDDPEGAFAWIDQLDRPFEKEVAIESLMRSWVESDPFAASEYLNENPKLPFAAKQGVISGWVLSDPHAAVDWVLNLNSPSEQYNLFQIASNYLVTSNFTGSEILDVWNKVPSGHLKDGLLESLTYGWPGVDFSPLADELYGHGHISRESGISNVLASRWVGLDLDSAERFYEEHKSNQNSDVSLLKLEIFKEKVARDSNFAFESVDVLKQENDTSVLVGVIEELLVKDGPLAADFVLELEETPNFDGFLESFSMKYGRVDPKGALDWLAQNFDGTQLEKGTVMAMKSWVFSNEYEAGVYINSMEESRLRDIASVELVRSLAGSDFESAVDWVDSIGAREQRIRALEIVGQSMNEFSEEQAQIIAESNFNENDFKILESHIN